MVKLKIYHFHNGGEGGVLSVIKNLILFSNKSLFENHIIYAINRNEIPSYNIQPILGALTQQLFFYTPKNNFYYTCKKLSKLLPNDGAIIVAHDWVELGMVSNLGLHNPVIQFVHGDYDYYYDLSKKNAACVDLFIGVSDNITQTLKKNIPERIQDIVYIRFPVPNAYTQNVKKITEKNIIFIGRLTAEKGYYLLPEIANNINTSSTTYFKWHIVGTNLNFELAKTIWNENIDVQFYGNINNDKVHKLLSNMDFFILPSIAEGMPLSLIEAMKAGVIPLINNLKGGIDELIVDGKSGFKINDNISEDYIKKLLWLSENNNDFYRISICAKENADMLFNPLENIKIFENAVIKLNKGYPKLPKKIYGSRLDQQWIPNFFTKFIRSF